MTHRKHERIPVTVLALALAAALVASLVSAPPATADDGLDGMFRLGYRFVDVDGTETKYKEDINLDEGVRVFEIELDWLPADGKGAVADRISLDVNNFGGDPFETLSFQMQKFGSYDFSYNRTKSAYFYEDIILPIPLAGDPGLALAGDFHHFDFDRVRDTADLTVRINPRARFLLGLERFTKKGDSTTSLDVSRDEFEFDRPVDESYNDVSVGFEYAWDKATIVIEERYREFENDIENFLPGGSLGGDPNDATTLFNYFYDTPYEYDSSSTTVRLNARPTTDWLIRASAMVQSLDLDLQASEFGQGTTFTGAPLFVAQEGAGEIERDTELFDLDVSYLINDRFALVGGVRSHTFDQVGESRLGDSTFEGLWDVETTVAELGFEASVTSDVTLSLGFLAESRDVDHDEHEEETDHDGYYARLGWSPGDVFSLQASYEDSSYDDPFTLSSPTDRERFKVTAKIDPDGGFWADLNALFYDFENSDSGWDAGRDQYGLRFGYRQDRVDFQLGYNVIESDRQVDQLVTTVGFGGGATFLFPVLYEADSEFLDARVRFEATDRVRLGADVRLYDNDGSFGLEREDVRGYFELDVCESYLVNLAYRTVDYEEDQFSFDDYSADIIEVSVGYRF